MHKKFSFGAIMAICIGFGTAIGSATGDMAQGVAMGAGLGAALGAMSRKRRSA